MESQNEKGYILLGATGSVGSALARRLSVAGSQLFLVGRNDKALGSLATELSAASQVIDARDAAAVEQCVLQAAEQLGNVVGIANCAGSILLKPAHSTSFDEWNELIATNLTSCFAVTRASNKVLRTSGGSVVFASSSAASMGMPNHEAIAAAKAGIEGLVRSAAATYANKGIRFNAVAPGLVKSKMTAKLWNSAGAAAQSNELHPLGRLGEPDEIAAAMQWLLHPGNSWITGQVLNIDGGLANVMPRRTVRA